MQLRKCSYNTKIWTKNENHIFEIIFENCCFAENASKHKSVCHFSQDWSPKAILNQVNIYSVYVYDV